MISLRRLFSRPDATPTPVEALYAAVVAQARLPAFYAGMGVPDTLDGRFDLLALHAFLVLRRLKQEGADGVALGQELVDLMFADMDHNLREMGAGDLGVGKRVKTMAQAFYGRVGAYEAALAAPEKGDLESALLRNVYGTLGKAELGHPQAMARYVGAAVAALAACGRDDLLAGRPRFSPPEAALAEESAGAARNG